MAFATRTLRDTDSLITVIMDIDNDTASDNTGLDGSGIGAFANGAKVDIRRIWWALTQGTAAGNTGDVLLEFKGASSDTAAFRCCLLYTSPSPRDRTRSRMPSSA